MTLQSFPSDIAGNLAHVRERIAAAARACGRDPGAVRLIAVSKTHPAAMVREAYAAGQRDFGENYLQDALPKLDAVADLGITWHFIGAVQSNKTRAIAERFHWVHTVDRLKIAERLSAQCPRDKTLDVTLQVNVDGDPAKAGVAPERAAALVDAVAALPSLRLRGLMTILGLDTDPAEGYRRLGTLFASLADRAPASWDTVSMGMTADFEIAIAAGATCVRVGTAIFGARR
jgi:PLP dependent protein